MDGLGALSRFGRVALTRLTAVLGIMAGIAALGPLAAPAAYSDAPGASHCVPDPDATTTDYLVGRACPPAGFALALGYEPVLLETPAGWRYTKPAWANGECSGPMSDTGPFWDFGSACRTHDYGYDLIRFGVGSRGEADNVLFEDMTASCGGQFVAGLAACRTLAESALLTLEAGGALGFDPEPIHRD